jgi:hypothetical protein
MNTRMLFLNFLIIFQVIFAQIPQTISCQGFLSDVSGNPKPDGD